MKEFRILFNMMGGHGNQFFQMAMAKALSQHLDDQGVSSQLQYNLNLFDVDHKLAAARSFHMNDFSFRELSTTQKKFTRYFSHSKISRFINSLHLGNVIRESELGENYDLKKVMQRLLPEYSNMLHGFWQRPLLLRAAVEKQIDQFALSLPTHLEAERYVRMARDSETLALHVRRGDYVALKNLYGELSPRYYHRAFDLIKAKKKITKVLFFSDDLAWVKKNIQLPNVEATYVAFEEKLSSSYEFHVMQSASAFIIPNSTFSWWAAFLATLKRPNALVVAPQPLKHETYLRESAKWENWHLLERI